MNKKIEMEAIGIVETPYENAEDTPRQGLISCDKICKLQVYNKYIEGITDIKIGEEIYILFYFNKSKRVDLKLIPNKQNKVKGVFSTRTPNRPNHIGITKVKVIDKKQNLIYFIGGDMLNQTPILDIKPDIKNIKL